MQRREFVALTAAAACHGRLRSQPVSSVACPNILFAIADDWSYGHAGAYGCEWARTPAFDRVAREGILFTHAYTPNAKCAPSRSAILTGRNPWQLKAAANHWPYFPAEFRTWAETLTANGRQAGKTHKGWAPGQALDARGQQRQMAGQGYDRRTAEPPTPDIHRCDYAANFADFLADTRRGTPWTFWYGAGEPHRPYTYGSGVAQGGRRLSDVDLVPAYWPDNEVVRHDMLDYAYEVEHFDRHLGRMMDQLDARGELDNTLIIVTSDNGMPFPRVKGNAYHDATHLPLAVRWPVGITGMGRVVDDYVSFIDFAPTILELMGVSWEDSGMARITGRSLCEILSTPGDGRVIGERDRVLVGRERQDVGRPHDWGYPIRGIVADDWMYLRNFEPGRWPGGNPETGYLDADGGPTKTEVLRSRHDPATKRFWDACFGMRAGEELYDINADPDCLHNLAADPAQRARCEKMAAQMTADLTAQEDPRILGRGEVFDTYPCADAKAANFHERWLAGERLDAPWVSATDFESDFD